MTPTESAISWRASQCGKGAGGGKMKVGNATKVHEISFNTVRLFSSTNTRRRLLGKFKVDSTNIH